MLDQALLFLLDTFLGLLSLAFLLRFYLQLFRAPYHNPIFRFIAAVTDFAVRPVRRVIPGLWGMDIASLALAWLCELLLLYAMLAIKGHIFGSTPGLALGVLALLAVVKVIKVSIYILMVAVIVQAVLSWVNPYNPFAPLLNHLTRPFLRIFQKRIPTIGNVDLSPLFVVVLCQLILILPVAWLESSALRLF